MKICEVCKKEHDGSYGSGRFCCKSCACSVKKKVKRCSKCGKEISTSNFKKHYKSCKGGVRNIDDVEQYKVADEQYQCPYCKKIYKKLGIKIHIWRIHTKEGQEFKVNLRNSPRTAWNKGLTKDIDERVRKHGHALSERFKKGELVGYNKGKKMSQKQKDKISQTRIKYLLKHPEKVPYRLNHSSKMSYPEKIFKKALEENNIKGWVYNFHNSIYSYDFAFIELKIDVEIDGGTHKLEKVKKIDKRRDEFSKSQGWKVIRFSAKEVKENVQKCIDVIKGEIN